MKFLAIIVSFFVFGTAPVQASVKVVFANKVAPLVKAQMPSKEIIKCAAANKGSAILNSSRQTNLVVHSNYEINKYFDNDQLLAESINYSKLKLKDADRFTCKQIGLILIFPEHYFF